MQVEALHQVNAKLLHRLVFFSRLDAFRDHLRVVLVGKPDHLLDETLLDEIHVDAVDERDVELDEIRLEVGDRSESRITASRVVDRKPVAPIAKILESSLELRVIADRSALGNLE